MVLKHVQVNIMVQCLSMRLQIRLIKNKLTTSDIICLKDIAVASYLMLKFQSSKSFSNIVYAQPY